MYQDVPTLSKAKKETKLILGLGTILLFLILAVFTSGRIITFIKQGSTPPPPPQASFGKLPPIVFPNKQKENIAYSLNTLSGYLPNFGDRIKVYKINTAKPTLFALDKTRQKVAQVGFNSSETQLTQDTYQWADRAIPLQRKIKINIFSLDFTLSSPYLLIPTLQNFNSENDPTNAIEIAKSFLSAMSLFSTNIDTKKTKTALYSIDQGALVSTSKIASAKIIRVNFFQKDLDNLSIYYQDGAISTLDLLIAKENNQLKIVDAHYTYRDISQATSTYATKTTSEAFSELRNGKAYIVSNPQNAVEVTIKNALFGYYIGDGQQDFLMPVFIFTDNNGFIAYVSAIKDEWISN